MPLGGESKRADALCPSKTRTLEGLTVTGAGAGVSVGMIEPGGPGLQSVAPDAHGLGG